jgi:hypothetical protein
MIGGIAQAEQRLDVAARALARAAEESAVMGFSGQAALHRATLARVQQQLGDPAAATTYRRAIGDATAAGDGRLAATARLNLARHLRGSGDRDAAVALLEENERWYDTSGGGDHALLTHCVLSAERGDVRALERVLAEARATGATAVQVLALDALARTAAETGDLATARQILAEADELALIVAHLVDDADRLDADAARQLADADQV